MPDAKTLLYASADGMAQGSYYGESDISQEDFFKKAMQGKQYITSLRRSIQDDEKVFIIAVPVKPINKTTGIIAAEYPASKLKQIIGHAKFGETGFAYIIDSKGLLLAHPDKKKIMQPILDKKSDNSASALIKRMLTGKHGRMTYHADHVNMTAVYYPIGNYGWAIASVIPESELYSKLSGVLWFTLIVLVAMGGVIFFISLKITKLISKPIVTLTLCSESLAQGNLTIDLPQGSFAELGRLEHAMHDMLANTSRIIQTIHTNMQNLTHAISELKHSSFESSKAAAEVSGISEQIAIGSEETANTATNITASAEITSANIKHVVDRLHIILQNSHESLQATKTGKTTLLNFSQKITEAQQSGDLIANMMEALSEKTNEIKSIAGVIGGISDQTNLLALNAAIEAARAGAHGAGFAVVAEEVRKLSDETRKQTREISEVITGINSAVSNIDTGLKHLLGVVDDQQLIGNQAIAEFTAIETQALNQGELLREIGEDADKSCRECEQVTNSIQTIAATCQQEAASAQEISAAMQELREVTYEMDAGICELDALMESLDSATSYFVLVEPRKITEPPDPAPDELTQAVQ